MSARRLPAAALLALTLLVTPAQAQVNPAWTDTITPFRVIDNVHYVGSAGLSAWLLTSPAGHILIDVGMPENAPMVAAHITALGFRVRDVKIILNTHAHVDHAGGIAAMQRLTGARVMAMAGDTSALQRGYSFAPDDAAWLHYEPVRVDHVVRDGEVIALGTTRVTANATPGHSPGCTTWTMPLRDGGAPHTAVFFCSATVANNRLAPVEQYPGIIADFARTFARLKSIRADVLLPPHAEFFDLRAKRARQREHPNVNPFVVPGEFAALVAELEKSFAVELARQRTRPAP